MSPVDSVLKQLHRQARTHLAAGGAAAPVSGKPKPSRQVGGDFYLPTDLDAEEVDREIRSKLSGSVSATDSGEPRVLQRKAGGRVVVPAAHLLRLGDGDFARGRRFLHSIIGQIRRRRMARLVSRRSATHLRLPHRSGL
jgi:hypothetical protein